MAARCPEHSRTTWTARDDMRSGSQDANTSRSAGSTTSDTPRLAARRRRPSCGSTTVMSEMPIDCSAATLRAPIGPGPEHHDGVAGGDARASDAVQRHRQRFGEGGMPWQQALGQPQHARLPHEDVLGEGTVRVLAGHALPVLALRRLALAAAAARAALGGGTADDQLADRPPGHVVADGGDGAAPLVAGHRTGLEAPAVAELMDVGPADAARVHAHDELVRPGTRDRALLHGDRPRRPIDGGRHDVWEPSRVRTPR